jgi:hypothetical protein
MMTEERKEALEEFGLLMFQAFIAGMAVGFGFGVAMFILKFWGIS